MCRELAAHALKRLASHKKTAMTHFGAIRKSNSTMLNTLANKRCPWHTHTDGKSLFCELCVSPRYTIWVQQTYLFMYYMVVARVYKAVPWLYTFALVRVNNLMWNTVSSKWKHEYYNPTLPATGKMVVLVVITMTVGMMMVLVGVIIMVMFIM